MKPITQKNLRVDISNGIRGDCLRACICSILEMPDEGVPNFVEDPDYPQQLLDFLNERGYDFCWSENSERKPDNIEYYMAWGKSPRGDWLHSVVYKDGVLVHDPHPDGRGIENIKRYAWIKERN